MGCYCCKNNRAQWSMKYNKILCQTCWESLETIELFREKIAELAKEKYKQPLDLTAKSSAKLP